MTSARDLLQAIREVRKQALHAVSQLVEEHGADKVGHLLNELVPAPPADGTPLDGMAPLDRLDILLRTLGSGVMHEHFVELMEAGG